MIILSESTISNFAVDPKTDCKVPVQLISMDEGDVFVSTDLISTMPRTSKSATGIIVYEHSHEQTITRSIPAELDAFVSVQLGEGGVLAIYGWVRRSNDIQACPVQIVSTGNKLYERTQGLYETEVLSSKAVLIIGLGSGGGQIAVELVKAGIGRFILIDDDRLEIGNVVRHVCGISDIGRFKTKAVAHLLRDKNPNVQVETYEEQVDQDYFPKLNELVAQADIVFCCTDNRASRTIVNRACVLKNRPCIYGGTFRRAYGGQVLRIIPKQTMCYQCFISTMPEKDQDREIASPGQAQNFAYADRPVAIEPGLATDIAPIALMCIKLGILELLRGTQTTLASLYEDLTGSVYQWLNRRELETQYALLDPMDSGGDGLRILAWFRLDVERDTECPVCGDFLDHIETTLTAEEIAEFGGDSGDISPIQQTPAM